MRSIIIILTIILSILRLNSQIVINEIMPAPEGGEPEWIEIFNNSDIEKKIESITLSDAAVPKLLPDLVLPSGEYVVLCRDTTELIKVRNIPETCQLIETTLPQFNNTNDMAILRDAQGKTIDTMFYDMSDFENGKSIERKNSSKQGYSKDNWGVAIDKTGATPGRKNSISAPDTSLTIEMSVEYNSQIPKFRIEINNTGLISISNLILELTIDTSFTGTNSLLLVKDIVDIESGDNTIKEYIFDLADLIGGLYKCHAALKSSVSAFCSATADVYFPIKEHSLKINEIMYDTDRAEFFELINISSSKINLRNCSFADESKSENPVNIDTNLILYPKSYGLICWDQAVFDIIPEFSGSSSVYCSGEAVTLNNSGDEIIIRDYFDTIIDSVEYSDKWHTGDFIDTKNISLERVNTDSDANIPESWASCADAAGHTALRKNSCAYNPSAKFSLEISPNPFSANIDGRCEIKYSTNSKACNLSVKIFNRAGQCMANLKRGEFSSGTGILEWNGKNDQGYLLEPDAYVLFFEITPENSEETKLFKKIIVLAE